MSERRRRRNPSGTARVPRPGASGERDESPFRIERSSTLASAAFLVLEQVHVVGPDEESFDRVVVRHPGAVAVVPVDVDGNAVLVRQYRAALDRAVLEVPAGKRDVEGEPPEETARRELEEEVGLAAGTLDPLGVLVMSPGVSDEEAHLFLARDLREASGTEPLRHEEAAMTQERVPLGSVPALVARGELSDAKSVAALLLARDHLQAEA